MKILSLILLIIFAQTAFAHTAQERANREAARVLLRSMIDGNQTSMESLTQQVSSGGDSFDISSFPDEAEMIVNRGFRSMGTNRARAYLADYIAQNQTLSETNKLQRGYFLQNARFMYRNVLGNNPGDQRFSQELCQGTALDPLENFWENLTPMRNVSECTDLSPGESKTISEKGRNFRLRRTQDGNYQAVFNLNFNYLSGETTPNEMMNRLRSCLALPNSQLRGPPPERAKLELIPMTPDEAARLPSGEMPPPDTITLARRELPGHSAQYTDEMNCMALTHELLHRFNLPDEYVEYPGRGYDYSCRVDSTDAGIMNNMNRAWERNLPRTSNCSCDRGCQTVLSSGNQSAVNIMLAEAPGAMSDGLASGNDCTISPARLISSGSTPDRAVRFISAENDTFSFFNTRVQGIPGSSVPVAFTEERWDCKYRPHPTLTGDLAKEEFQRFQRKVNRFRDRSLINPRSVSCPLGAKVLASGPGGPGTNTESVLNNVLTINRAPEEDSLLRPDQFNRILAGSCASRSTKFRQCQAMSYIPYNDPKCDKELRKECWKGGFVEP